MECFETERPVLTLTLYDAKKEKKITADFLIDTGFSGYLISDYEIYSKLNSVELPVTKKYRTVSGVIEVYSSRVFVEYKGTILSTFLESSPYLDYNLIGRELLKNFDLCVYKMRKVCVSLAGNS